LTTHQSKEALYLRSFGQFRLFSSPRNDFYRAKKNDEGQPVGIQYTNSFEGEEDEVLAFFMNCYHLKDWIKNDIGDTHLDRLVENLSIKMIV
jgi:hypothetical protein